MGKRREYGPSGGRPFNENSFGKRPKKNGALFFDLSVSGEGRKLPADSKPTPQVPVDGEVLLEEIKGMPRYVKRRGYATMKPSQPLDKSNEQNPPEGPETPSQ